jgi:hypothetical protein
MRALFIAGVSHRSPLHDSRHRGPRGCGGAIPPQGNFRLRWYVKKRVNKTFAIAFGAAIVVIAILIWSGFVNTAGNHLAPTGKIGKIRAVAAADDLTYMVIDFNVKNDSDRDMIVRSVESDIATADGDILMGTPVAAADVVAAFQSYPVLGDQYNPVLKERDKIPPHQSLDRMVGLRIDAPIAKVEGRKQVTLRVEDVTGPVLELKK